MIRLESVSKSFRTKHGRRYALRDVSFSMSPLARVGLLGVNGAGKSTLLRLIGKIDFPDSGRIDCRHTVSWPVGLSTAYQGSMTARENTRFVGRINGVEDLASLEAHVGEFSELGEYFDLPIRTYSSGMKSRFAFALSMAIDFDIYLIDEVTAAGDQRFRRKCRETLESKMERSGIFMVSHNLDEIRRHCTTGLLLDQGSVKVFEDIDTAIETYQSRQRIS